MSRRFLLVALGSIVLAAAPAGHAAPSGLELTVELVNLRSEKGEVRVSLFSSPDGFPGKHEKAAARAITRIKNGRATVKLSGLRPGLYALSAFHDENGNHKLDTNFLGIPKEGIAASNDAKATFGPPSFKAASFRLEAGRTQQRLRMFYR